MPPDRTLPTEDTKLSMHAYLDGELSEADALAVRQTIEVDPTLAGQFETYRALQETLRSRFTREPLSPHLRARINAATGTGRKPFRPTWMALAAAVLLAIVGSSASTWLILRSGGTKSEAPTTVADAEIDFPRMLGVRYATVADGPSGLVRDLYASQAALDAVRSGRPVPDGAVLVRNAYEVERDAAGIPLKDANGNLIRSKLLFTAVMEKRAGRSDGSPTGDWRYQSFAPNGAPMADSSAECFACHTKVRNQDFIFSYDQMKVANH